MNKEQMQGKELVLYWVRQSMADPQAFVDILKATNTMLALQGNPDLFMGLGAYNKSSVDAANLVRLCNKAGVKVEIWPVGSQSLPIGLSLRYVDGMPVEYQYFKDWLHRNNITITYYAFDIEDGDQWANFANTTVGRSIPQNFPLYGTLNGIYDMAARQEFLRVNRSNWPELVAKQQALIDQIRADGFIPRATINPGATGALDGDLSGFEQNYEQSYEIKGYDYLSSMYYRSCEWGNNDSTYKVYQNVRILHEISTYNRTAICIGCITYPAYRTATEVANDVWLACANGAVSVRIFLGDSWVYSAVNESAGIQSLHSMLDLCRAGGTAITEYHAKWDNDLFITILGSVFGDL